ncbi:MAG TPA: hypothetical protein VGJ71_05780 [Candidatus Limnocylindrales bacterium]
MASDAGFAGVASASPDPPEPPEPASELSGEVELELSPSAEVELALEPSPSAEVDVCAGALDVELRSFFAQPVPLKWTDGAENPFRTGEAPQIGQTSGATPLMEWMTSNRWPFGQM